MASGRRQPSILGGSVLVATPPFGVGGFFLGVSAPLLGPHAISSESATMTVLRITGALYARASTLDVSTGDVYDAGAMGAEQSYPILRSQVDHRSEEYRGNREQ